MIINIHPDNPEERKINQVVEILKTGGIIIYPTDTIYGFGCDINNHKAVEKIAMIKGIKAEKANFSFICENMSDMANYTKPISNFLFKIMKNNLPGPFTFVLKANNKVPKLFKSKKKTVGIRIPDNNIAIEIVKQLGNPILTTSLPPTANYEDYLVDPYIIEEEYSHLTDIVIDGGYGDKIPSTVINCVTEELEIIRQGKGILKT